MASEVQLSANIVQLLANEVQLLGKSLQLLDDNTGFCYHTKVFEIKSYDEDGDIHTSFAAVCLRKTLADVLKGTNIPLESIVSVNVTPPMNVLDAMEWIRIKNAGCRLRFGGLIK